VIVSVLIGIIVIQLVWIGIMIERTSKRRRW
jgi:hypothetical protein